MRIACLTLLLAVSMAAQSVKTQFGLVEGTTSTDGKIRIFEGIPFAAPPVGDLRWKPPQPVTHWEGVRKATAFGARCMQAQIYSDMVFRDDGPSEDCLYLNVWTPATSADEHLPVMVWIYGGGFQAGAASEPRQDGTNLAHKGVIVVSMNYRLGIFGFFAHPELAKESPQGAAGNYGLEDQAAAIKWVHDNIAAFGGDPANITIFGESAGSMSVSSQMASPLAKDLFEKAIGESGAVFGTAHGMPTLQESEKNAADFATKIGASTLKDLRAKSGKELLDAVMANRGEYRFWPDIDGYFFTEDPRTTYANGHQAHVPLLAGWNQDEQSYATLLGKLEPTPENYSARLKATDPQNAAGLLKYYPGDTEDQVKVSAGQLAGDRFIAFSTWKWLEYQTQTGQKPVYRYHFEQAPPAAPGYNAHGAYHSSDILYVFGTLDSEKRPWTDADREVSRLMSTYWTNFAKTGDPNGDGVPKWPSYAAPEYQVMHLNASAHAAPDDTRQRYLFLDSLAK